MQVLEVYFDGSTEYYLLSRNTIDLINATCRTQCSVTDRLGESTECCWSVTASQLRNVLSRVDVVTDATNLMRLIIDTRHRSIKLSATSWQELTVAYGEWHNLKPKYRAGLETRGITDGSFIFQGV